MNEVLSFGRMKARVKALGLRVAAARCIMAPSSTLLPLGAYEEASSPKTDSSVRYWKQVTETLRI
jgi:hypothetical protein